MVLDEKTINRIAYDFFKQPTFNISEIVGKGIVNRTFLVETFEGKFIFRAREANATAEYRKEKWCLEQAHKLGVPSPQVIYIGVCEDVSYMIETCVDGINGFEGDKPEEAWFQIGSYAKKLHSIPVAGFGMELADEQNGVFTDGFSPTLERQIEYNISQLTPDDVFRSLGIYDESHLNDIVKVFEYVGWRGYRIGLNHGDLSLKNTMVDKNNNVSLIDYGCALAHVVPFYDFTYVLRDEFRANEANGTTEGMIRSFMAGYGISPGEFNDMKKDIFAVMLLNAFDKARWAFDRRRESIKEYATFANKVLLNTLEFFR